MDQNQDGGGAASSRYQQCGILMKQPFGKNNQSTKWTKRFFIVKDGYLLYYNECEKKEFDKTHIINLHPKGILILGKCSVEESSDPSHPFCIQIHGNETQSNVLLCAESALERKRWIQVLHQASRITWRNAQLGDAMIQKLEEQGLQSAREKQEYFDRYKNETQQSVAHQSRAEELQKMNEELEKRKEQLENYVSEMKKEYDEMQRQLSETAAAARSVEETKEKLHLTAMQLQKNLEELEMEKNMISDNFLQQQMESMELSREKRSLSETTDQLSNKLAEIEAKMKKITAEKSLAEYSLRDQEVKAKQLLEDNLNIGQYAQQLSESLKNLSNKMAATEVELREEVTARMEAEKRLHEAEMSLSRLESTLEHQQKLLRQKKFEQESEDAMIQMIGDVKTLKKFFENVSFEAKLDAKKGLMIKQSIDTRKAAVRRTKTMLLDNLHIPMELSGANRTPLMWQPSTDFDFNLTPTTPSAVNELFSDKAEKCLNSSRNRHSAFALLQSIDMKENTAVQNV